MNCGAQVAGRFCQVCGQENIAIKETFWHLVTHFFNDITHYDGKFFSTIKLLLLKPGMLTSEYVRGRRTAYLHPIRMYVFTSAFFFLLYFTFFSTKAERKDVGAKLAAKEHTYKQLEEIRSIAPDSVTARAVERAMKNTSLQVEALRAESANAVTTKKNGNLDGDVSNENVLIDLSNRQLLQDSVGNRQKNKDFFDYFEDADVYQAVQNELPAGKKDDRLERVAKMEYLRFYQKQQKEGSRVLDNIQDKFKHSFPTILFISLPIFAWFLYLLYGRKKMYYAEHGIFAIHVYCGVFLLMLLYYLLDAVNGKLHGWILNWLMLLIGVYIVYFVYKAMRNFYGQGRWTTLFKFLSLSFMTSVVMLILIIIFLVISAYRV